MRQIRRYHGSSHGSSHETTDEYRPVRGVRHAVTGVSSAVSCDDERRSEGQRARGRERETDSESLSERQRARDREREQSERLSLQTDR